MPLAKLTYSCSLQHPQPPHVPVSPLVCRSLHQDYPTTGSWFWILLPVLFAVLQGALQVNKSHAYNRINWRVRKVALQVAANLCWALGAAVLGFGGIAASSNGDRRSAG